MYLDHASLMEQEGWSNAFFSMRHPKNLQTPWERFFVDELEFGNPYSPLRKVVMASKVIYSFEARRKLRALLAEYPADIAHLHCIYHHLSPSILSTLADFGVPAVMTAHDLKIACPAYKMLNDTGICERCRDGSVWNVVRHSCVRNSLSASVVVALESALHRQLGTYQKYLAKIVVPSKFFLEKFVEWGWPRDKFSYIPNYVDAKQFRPDFNPGDYFLYFGRLAPEKGVATLLRAAKQARVKLRIAGVGPEEMALKELQAGLAGDIEFLGHQTGEALHDVIRGARVVVLPSEWYENAPISVLESFALGKPVVGARIGGIPEMISEGRTGWTFESGNLDELTSLLVRLNAENEVSLKDAGRAARERVERDFNRAGYLMSTLALYAELGVKA